MTEQEWLTSTDPGGMLAEVMVSGDGEKPTSGREISDRKVRYFALACAQASNRLSQYALAAIPHIEEWLDNSCEGSAYGYSREAHQALAALSHSCDAAGPNWVIEVAGGLEGVRSVARHTLWECALSREVQADLVREIVGNPFRPVSISVLVDAEVDSWAEPDWLTPQVLSLARAAYEERASLECLNCKDADFSLGDYGGPMMGGQEPYSSRARAYWASKCVCKGTRRVEKGDGTLDNLRLMILADALEEAGCEDDDLLRHLRGWERCPTCCHYKSLIDICSAPCDHGWIHSPGPHYRGCWALDLILGKE